MPVSDYYGRKQGTTHLDLWVDPSDGSEPIIARQLSDQDAYDTWHLALYMKEILQYKRLGASSAISLEQLPRKEKNLLLYLVLASRPRFKTVVELGSSLFELIDGLEVVKKCVPPPPPPGGGRPQSLVLHRD